MNIHNIYDNIICITNRKLVEGDYISQLEKVCALKPGAVVLREKDMSENEYDILAEKIVELGKKYEVEIIINTYYKVAIKYNCKSLHLPFGQLKEIAQDKAELVNIRKSFDKIGTSVHSIEDLKIAEMLGVDYAFAGHIFETDCKKGVTPRGIGFLQAICDNARIPIYAIGGINLSNMEQCLKAGAKGVCMMSEFMKI